jgi:hypothetical protein
MAHPPERTHGPARALERFAVSGAGCERKSRRRRRPQSVESIVRRSVRTSGGPLRQWLVRRNTRRMLSLVMA